MITAKKQVQGMLKSHQTSYRIIGTYALKCWVGTCIKAIKLLACFLIQLLLLLCAIPILYTYTTYEVGFITCINKCANVYLHFLISCLYKFFVVAWYRTRGLINNELKIQWVLKQHNFLCLQIHVWKSIKYEKYNLMCIIIRTNILCI